MSESTPLLGSQESRVTLSYSATAQPRRVHTSSGTSIQRDSTDSSTHTNSGTHTGTFTTSIHLHRRINLFHAVSLVIGACSGSGIFVSPTGVTRYVGSVGASLLVWLACGLLHMVLALCYAELATALPVAGGDYAYLRHIFGPLPAFMSLWLTLVLLAPGGVAVISRTVGVYAAALFHLEDHVWLVVCTALLVGWLAAYVNTHSMSIAAKVNSLLSVGKILAMMLVILMGFVQLLKGKTDNFSSPFEGSNTSPGSIILGLLSGFVTYIGWDSINAMAEEMINPTRDIPLASAVGLSIVTSIYTLINLAYFTVLTPEQFVASDAVASSFVKQVFSAGLQWIIPVFIMMSASGTLFSLFMALPRVVFAGGRVGAMPQMFAFVHIHNTTPIPGILLLSFFGSLYTSFVFLDLQQIIQLSGMLALLKLGITLLALLYLKIKMPETKRSFKVPLLLVVFGLVCMAVMISLSVYEDPYHNGIGLVVVLLSVPVYYLGEHYRYTNTTWMDGAVRVIQKVLLVAPVPQKVT